VTGIDDGMFEGTTLGGKDGQFVTILEYSTDTLKVFVNIHPPEGGSSES